MADLVAIARETLAILDQGWYLAPGGAHVEIAGAQAAAVAGTRLYRPGDLERLVATGVRRGAGDPAAPGATGPAPAGGDRRSGRRRRDRSALAVTAEKTQAAARRLVQDAGHADLAVLNFASATNPGGGFLRGARAQEEDLARASGLFRCLQTQPAYYQANREDASPLYTDHLIHSPAVPWIRDGDLRLLPEPYLAAVITAPAPNASRLAGRGGGLTSAQQDRVRTTLARRAGHVLAVAAAQGHRTLLLGAWGCGVFGNDPRVVADVWLRQLCGRRFAGCFDRVEFAVFDPTDDRRILAAFRERVPGAR